MTGVCENIVMKELSAVLAMASGGEFTIKERLG